MTRYSFHNSPADEPGDGSTFRTTARLGDVDVATITAEREPHSPMWEAKYPRFTDGAPADDRDKLLQELVQSNIDHKQGAHWMAVSSPAMPDHVRRSWTDALSDAGLTPLHSKSVWQADSVSAFDVRDVPQGLELEFVGNDVVSSDDALAELFDVIHTETADALDALILSDGHDYVRYLSTLATSCQDVAWVVTRDGEATVGMCCVARQDDELWVYDVGVRPSTRGKSLASAMLSVAVRAVAHDEAVPVCALIDHENAPSIALHEKFGLKKSPRQMDIWYRNPK